MKTYFYGMNRKSQSLFILLFVSLTGLLGLQFFYGFQIYQQQAQDLQKQLDRYAKAALNKSHTTRIDKINSYFAADIKSGKYASLFLGMDKGKRMLYVRDVLLDRVIMSIHYANSASDTVNDHILQDYLIARNWADLSSGELMYWTEALGNRLIAYNDSIRIEEKVIQKELKSIFEKEGITNEFSLALLDEKKQSKYQWPSYISSSLTELPLLKNQFLQVYLKYPNSIILKRMRVLLFISIFVLLLVSFSFILLLRTLKKQRKLSAMKDDFIANVTHEMLTPITSQRLALDRLKKQESVARNPMVQILDQQTERFEEIINQTLKASFQDHHEVYSFENLSPRNLIEDVVIYQRSNTDKEVVLDLQIPKGISINTSKKVLTQVVHNLINNAIAYNNHDHVQITVTYQLDDQFHYFDFTDNGIGILKKDQGLIFGKFHRVHKDEAYRNKGLGIGLYYSRELLRRVEADLKLVQSSQLGSTFRITLPKIHSK